MKGISGRTAANADRDRNALASAVRLQNERFGRINDVLKKQLKSMNILHKEIMDLQSVASFELDVTAYVACELVTSMSVLALCICVLLVIV